MLGTFSETPTTNTNDALALPGIAASSGRPGAQLSSQDRDLSDVVAVVGSYLPQQGMDRGPPRGLRRTSVVYDPFERWSVGLGQCGQACP